MKGSQQQKHAGVPQVRVRQEVILHVVELSHLLFPCPASGIKIIQ